MTEDEALQDSIKHWTRMAEQVFEMPDQPSGYQCALCEKYNSEAYVCKGCPVMEHTGKTRCRNTPYTEALARYQELQLAIGRWKDAAKAEVEFLKKLQAQH